jgi:hypothetical protein
MHVVHPVCCGIDGQAAPLTACLRRVGADGTIRTAWRDFGTTDDQLLALRAWRDAQRCPIAVLESPGVYWKPLYHVLVDTLEVVAHVRSVRQRPGTKTDKADAAWLAGLVAHGLVEPRGDRKFKRVKAYISCQMTGQTRHFSGDAAPWSRPLAGPRGDRDAKSGVTPDFGVVQTHYTAACPSVH